MTLVGTFVTTAALVGSTTTGNRWQSWYSLTYTATITTGQTITLYVYDGSVTNANIDEDSTSYSTVSYTLSTGTNELIFLDTIVEKMTSIKLKFMLTTTTSLSPTIESISLKELDENWYVTTSYPFSGKHAPRVVFQNMMGKEKWNGLNRGDSHESFIPMVLTIEFLYPLNFDEINDSVDWDNNAKNAIYAVLDTFLDNMEDTFFDVEEYGFEPLVKAAESENVILDTFTYAYTIDFETVYHKD